MSYKLSVDELRYCITIGAQRQTTNVHNKIRSKQFTMRDPTMIHIQGVLGEYGFAQLCNRDLAGSSDTKTVLNNTQSRGAKHDTFDWNVFGQKIDVKTTLSKYANRIYARTHKSKNPADWYVLMLIEFLDAKTHQAHVPKAAEYDAYVKNADQFQVQVTFQGAATKTQILDASESNGALAVTPSIKTWSDFSAQMSKCDNSASNVLTSVSSK